MEQRCLYCYEPLASGETDFHPKCSRKMFGTALPPLLPYDENQLDELALEVVRSHTAITGVQPKLSLHLDSPGKNREPQRFTIVGLWGGYILKPPSQRFPQLPEIEDLTMHMAEALRIATVPHCLIRMKSGKLAYLTRRIDRTKKGKLHMEDMCQITGRLTENKYDGSYEQIAKAILRFSVNPRLDVINFFGMVLFCFLTGNADMHLKNFSLIDIPEKEGVNLAPAYDLLSTALMMPSDDEDLALTLNGKKKRITFKDMKTALQTLSVDEVVQDRMFSKFSKARPVLEHLIDKSFLDTKLQTRYKELVMKKYRQIGLV
ncbi:MAG: type II toxin-antitoxin system HipA family toxin [Chlorobaculum sp.]|nr:type II toxin-antitoxin system HipA family toxin [Chlorobaculum sp.]